MVNSPRINDGALGLSCLRAGHELEFGDYFTGCPICLQEGFPSSVRHLYPDHPAPDFSAQSRGMQRFSQWLPYLEFTSLGEGGTPLVSLDRIAIEFSLEAVYVKNEGQNPTGSHKDRMSALAIARAKDVGANTVVVASSGNAGASVAAYAAAVSLKCEVVTTPRMNPNWRQAIEITGARLVAAADPKDRWRYVADRVRCEGWFSITNFLEPPVGSNHYGVEGLKTIAFELFADGFAESIDAVLVPTSRADLLWGIYEGFRQLHEASVINRIPRLHAVEPFPRISRVLDGTDYREDLPGDSKMVSVGGTTVTYQAIQAIQGSNGTAIAVSEDAVVRDQKTLAESGLYLELSSAMTLDGLRRLRANNTIRAGERVVLIGSSHGYKEVQDPHREIAKLVRPYVSSPVKRMPPA